VAGKVSLVFDMLLCDDQETNHDFLTVTGTLKGYDQLMNLVLDNVEEVTRGMHPAIKTPSLDQMPNTNACFRRRW
jgi:hypothetical protein